MREREERGRVGEREGGQAAGENGRPKQERLGFTRAGPRRTRVALFGDCRADRRETGRLADTREIIDHRRTRVALFGD